MPLICIQSEVTEINKQKFLTELAKLLTFMYDEDRQIALGMYSELFDSARDEQSLLQFLVSPTRQAVIIARAYNARERKLQVNTQSREEEYYEDEGTPDFVLAIEALEQDAYERGIAAPKIPADQFSLFADGVHPANSDDVGTAADTAVAEASETTAIVEATAVELDDDDIGAAEVIAEAVEIEENGDTGAVTDTELDEVDAFLSEFSIADAPPATADEAPAEEQTVETASAGSRPHTGEERVQKGANAPSGVRRNAEGAMAEAVDLTERKPIVWLLILYVIAAIPIVAVCVLVLLIPTLFFLLMAVGAVALGCMALSSAFGAFTIFADVMVVLGAALVILALGLLFLWLFVWLVGGAIAGFINAIIKLGGKWCYKEVSAA